MSGDILHVPAGVIQPKDLLMWLRKRRDEARETANEYADQDGPDDYEAALWRGREDAFAEVVQHISSGGAS